MTRKVQKLQRACLRNPVKIESASKYSNVDTLKHEFCFLGIKYKDCYLVYVLTEKCATTSMVFTRTCKDTRRLALMLRNLGIRAIPIFGQMIQEVVCLENLEIQLSRRSFLSCIKQKVH